MFIFAILVALMVGGLLGVGLMCMLAMARRGESDDASDGPRQTLAQTGTKIWTAGGPRKRMHRAAAKGEVACLPWSHGSTVKQPVLRMRPIQA